MRTTRAADPLEEAGFPLQKVEVQQPVGQMPTPMERAERARRAARSTSPDEKVERNQRPARPTSPVEKTERIPRTLDKQVTYRCFYQLFSQKLDSMLVSQAFVEKYFRLHAQFSKKDDPTFPWSFLRFLFFTVFLFFCFFYTGFFSSSAPPL